MITQKGKYAIKALIYLAERGSLVRTQEISDKARIPKKFLESILLELKRYGLVASQQGATGGYFLAKSPSEISLAELYRIFEGPIALIGCASEKFYQPCQDCENVETCTLRIAMQQVRSSTLTALESMTIQKIMAKP